MLFLGRLEYVILRLIRRFLVTDHFLIQYGSFIPYYRVNSNQVNPKPIIDQYEQYCQKAGIVFLNCKVILEIGTGATNASGYEMLSRAVAHNTAANIMQYEPYVTFDPKGDQAMRDQYSDRLDFSRVQRMTSLAAVAPESVDIILSNSVLEHVEDMNGLLIELRRVLKKDGKMLHLVDYRDHFFKYPYHFLTFSNKCWQQWLNPGDLPRWRLDDQLQFFKDCGFQVDILDKEILQDEFIKVEPYIYANFKKSASNFAVTHAVLMIS